MMREDWYHRGPCHRCRICEDAGCYVYNPDPPDDYEGQDDPRNPLPPEVHICANGCDGVPSALVGVL